MNVVDSSGWLEYLADSTNADFFAQPIEDTESLVVPTISIYEVFKRVLQQRGENFALQAVALMQQARVVDLDSSLALAAAKLGYELRLPLADSIIYATALSTNSTFWTQDSDFENIPSVKYIRK